MKCLTIFVQAFCSFLPECGYKQSVLFCSSQFQPFPHPQSKHFLLLSIQEKALQIQRFNAFGAEKYAVETGGSLDIISHYFDCLC